MQISKNSGLNHDDVSDIKVFLRTYNDAIQCAKSVAERDAQVHHYKQYMKILIDSLKQDKMMIDSQNQIIAAEDPGAANIYQLIKFSQSLFQKYKFDEVDSKKDFEKKLDQAITSMEKEIQVRRANIQKLMSEVNLNKKEILV
ncbi:UNKNOWN [Stylonychia lemnae]|uniref:Uncharacterized protein n=1 Tax=Stylonychia lemnae TaxID=5949 RepID=A0A078AIK2_STYLE|nr:UNKNOWN [Stylonychia lemnae]|eukprot:CDW82085.1 UNKNOWN [Stylonychia lemnae]